MKISMLTLVPSPRDRAWPTRSDTRAGIAPRTSGWRTLTPLRKVVAIIIRNGGITGSSRYDMCAMTIFNLII